MTNFTNQTEYDELIKQRNNINLAIENLLTNELELKGHTVCDEDIEEERMSLFYNIDSKDAKFEMLTKELVLLSLYGLLECEDE